MKGSITKYRKTDGRISWGYYYKVEGRQHTKSGFPTKFDASKELGVALAKHQDHGVSPKSVIAAHWRSIFVTGLTTMPRYDGNRRPSSATVSLRTMLYGCLAKFRFSI